MINIYKFRNGLNIIPRSDGSSAPVSQGDLAVSSVDGKIYYNDGNITSPLVTEAGPATLTNKIIDSGSNSFINISNANIAANAAIAFSKLAPLPDAKILIGNSSNVATPFPITGDISLSDTGVTAYNNNVPLTKGGTGATYASSAALFNGINPMTTTGDILYESATNTASRLAIGSSGQILTVVSGVPAWAPAPAGFVNPMTSVGDMIIGGVSGAATRLAATTNGFILTLASGSPTWVANSGGSAPNSVGALDGQSPNAMGLSIVSNILYAQSASASVPGMVNTGTQSLAGAKTFVTSISSPTGAFGTISDNGSGLIINSSSGTNINITPGTGGRTIVNSVLDLKQITSPSSPGAGLNSIFFKSDNNLYIKNSSGIETLVAPGMTGSNWVSAGPTIISAQTTAPTKGTTTIDNTFYRRVGDSMEFRFEYLQSSVGSSGSGTYLIQIPAGYSIDNTKIDYAGANSNINTVGSFTIGDNSTFAGKGNVRVYDSTHLALHMIEYNGSVNIADWGSGFYSLGNGVIGVSFEATIPIAGWTINNGYSPGQIGANFFASSKVTGISSIITSPTFVTASNSPALTITPTITGTYRIYSNVNTVQQAASQNASSRIFNTSGGATLLYESQGQNFSNGGQDRQTSTCESIYTLTAGTTYVFDIQLANTIGGSGVYLEGNYAPFYMFGELITNTTGLGLGGVGATLFLSATPCTTYAPLTTSTYTTFSNSPTLTFTPAVSGTYKVYANPQVYVASAGDTGNLRIFNTSGGATTILQQQTLSYDSGSSLQVSQLASTIYTLVAGTTYSFDVQGKSTMAGTFAARGDQIPYSIYAELIGNSSGGGGGGSGVSSLNSLTGSLSIAAGSGITVTPSGSTITIAATGGGGGANTTLSNLGTTAINANLIPATDTSENLGSASKRWNQAYITQISSGVSGLNLISDDATSGSSGTGSVFISTGNTTGSATGSSATASLASGSNSNTSNSNDTGAVVMQSGSTNGTGASGPAEIFTGAITNTGSTSVTGSLVLQTGNTNGLGGTGPVVISSGLVSGSASSGSVQLNSGNSKGSGQTSGTAILATGGGTVGANSGNISINTGVTTGGGTRGSVNLTGSAINLNSPTTIGLTSTTLTHSINTSTGTNATGAGTITNLPSGASGNPTGYISININGVLRYIPFW